MLPSAAVSELISADDHEPSLLQVEETDGAVGRGGGAQTPYFLSEYDRRAATFLDSGLSLDLKLLQIVSKQKRK